ncbi:hypothetical protein [Paraburkholderia sp. BL17N1]|uniref:hypothetical protein n=1 Tax=Paraburkholderia sp. BL17N1 TaxID=1938798 RepID=UPI000EB046D6|nr:hypothetical protein [Paraburkholderia sp. BL17N1]RKR46274.1 hypothetical protein B0G82_3956 [Paraburkholderia sp. BL17N1]
MGKFFNQEIYRQLERQVDRGLDEAMGDAEPPLTEEERAAEWDRDYWDRVDAVPRSVRLGDEMYAPGINHVRLGDTQ